MPIVNNTNFTNKVPTSVDDYSPWIQNSDGLAYTATMQQYADLFASLASLNLSVTVVDADVTLTTEQFVEANAAGAFSITLPASSLNTGRRYIIFNKGAGIVTVLPNGADTIAGAASITIAQYATVQLTSDGLGMWSSLVSA